MTQRGKKGSSGDRDVLCTHLMELNALKKFFFNFKKLKKRKVEGTMLGL